MYRSPESGITTTIRRLLLSGRDATASAACSAAPHESPASRPTRRAQRQAVPIASSSLTATISSISSVFSTAGTNPAPIPWMRCGPGRPPDSTGEPAGSTATIRRRG